MPTDFRYIPLAPEALSGPSFIDQTEQAINELGEQIDIAVGGAESALRIAQQALSTANEALDTANNAMTTADNAQNTANEALTAANNAQTAADNAQTTANQALTAANQAQSAAELAQQAAENAQTSANEAKEIAERAEEISQGLESDITLALALASGEYTTQLADDDPLDADAEFATPKKVYLVLDTNTNFPVSMPCFFEVLRDSNLNAVTQRAWTIEDPRPYQRTGAIDNTTTPGTPTVAWNQWSQSGEGGEVNPNSILQAITVSSAAPDLDNVLNLSGNYYAANTAIANLPAPVEGLLEVRSDTENSHTIQRYTALDGRVWNRSSTSDPEITDGTSTYIIAFTSGTFTTSVQATLSVSNNQMVIFGQNSYLYVYASTTGTVFSPRIEFWAPASSGIDFDSNGYSLTITPQTGASTVNVSVAGDGTETITSDTAEFTGISTIKYLSSSIQPNENAIVYIDIAATWLDFTGTIDWTAWVQSGAPSNYSTTAQPTGQTWIDGSPIYQITVACGALPNASIKNVAHGLTITRLIKAEGVAQTAAADSFLLLPHVGALADGGFNIQLTIDDTDIILQTSSDESLYTQSYVTLTYTG